MQSEQGLQKCRNNVNKSLEASEADIHVCVPHIQSVKKVIFRLLVLQEQLKVFEDLTKIQQRFILYDIY